MPATLEAAAAPPTPDHCRARVLDSLDATLPLLEGALHFTPSHLVEGPDELLTSAGHQFAGMLYALCAEATAAVHRAAFDLPPDVQGVMSAATEARPAVERATLAAWALTQGRLPAEISAHDTLASIAADLRAAADGMRATMRLRARA